MKFKVEMRQERDILAIEMYLFKKLNMEYMWGCFHETLIKIMGGKYVNLPKSQSRLLAITTPDTPPFKYRRN